MMRRRPTAVYRVLDEEDLLFGTAFVDEPGRPPFVDGSEPRPDPVAATGDRRRAIAVCAGALILAVLVARLASVLLAGSGSARSARPSEGRGVSRTTASPATVPQGAGGPALPRPPAAARQASPRAAVAGDPVLAASAFAGAQAPPRARPGARVPARRAAAGGRVAPGHLPARRRSVAPQSTRTPAAPNASGRGSLPLVPAGRMAPPAGAPVDASSPQEFGFER